MEEVEKHCKSFYIRANRCDSLYNDIFALRGWRIEEINGIEFELNSILVEKWKGKAYRLVIQRQKRIDGVQDLWEGEYTYRCILTNDYESSVREIVEFYNLRGGKERIKLVYIILEQSIYRGILLILPDSYHTLVIGLP